MRRGGNLERSRSCLFPTLVLTLTLYFNVLHQQFSHGFDRDLKLVTTRSEDMEIDLTCVRFPYLIFYAHAIRFLRFPLTLFVS